MRPCRRIATVDGLVVGRIWRWASLAALIVAGPAFAGEPELLQLSVDLNGRPIGKIGEFILRDGMLFSRPRELGELGLRVLPGSDNAADTPLPLSSLSGMTWRLDQATQTLYVSAVDRALVPTAIRPDADPTPLRRVESGTGAVANYDVVTTVAGGRTVGAGSIDLRVFSPWGTLTTNAIGYVGGGPTGVGQTSIVRLDSAYTYSDPDSLRQYIAGDFVTGSLASTRPVRLAGLQVSSDFALRPDLVTFPLPSVSGSVAVPSTVDVLLDGSRYVSRSLSAGPFEVPQLPVVTGASTVSMTVTNALGQQVAVELPVYASSSLLKPGLVAYSAQIGLLRSNYGLLSSDYGTLAGVATYRQGITPELTVEATVEASPRVVMGGGGGVVNVGGIAVVQASAQGSRSAGTGFDRARSGTQFSLGFARTGRVASFSASATLASAGFRDLASVNGDYVPRLRINAGAGLSLGRFGSVAVTYIGTDRGSVSPRRAYVPLQLGNYDLAAPLGGFVQYTPIQRSHVLSASYSVQFGRVSAFLTGYKDLVRHGGSGMLIGLSIPLSGRSSAGATGGFGSDSSFGEMQVQQSATAVGDWGYRASGTLDATTHSFGELSYKSPWGLVTAGADRTGHHSSARGEVSGAVSLLDNSMFLSNTIPDSFAVVDTDGVSGVEVLQENRAAGRTGNSGKLLVTDMRSFDVNRLAIEPGDVAMDMTLETTTREVRPQYRSGVVVRFPMQRTQSALLRLIDESGAAIPLGSVARSPKQAARLPIGFDGEAFIEHLEAVNDIDVERPDGSRCHAQFGYQPVPGEIPKIGPIVCRRTSP